MYKAEHRNRRPDTEFEKQWGIHVDELALAEDVTHDAIRMRVMKWGTPFQRRAKPSKYEKKYGKTQAQLAVELGIHPITVASREYTHGNVYYESNMTRSRWNYQKVTNAQETHWLDSDSWKFSLKSTFFTLEEAQEQLKKLRKK